jgi:SAM-dependent methyltransferase
METDLPEYVLKNRAAWDLMAKDYVEPGEHAWAESEPSWGIFSIPESEVEMFPAAVAGLDTIELGCGTAYISAWLSRRGARPAGIDNSPKQLETARRLQTKHNLTFPLHLGNAETTPFPDASFDLAISEYGASLWCDPYKWIPEAARLLRPGGLLRFLTNGLLISLCSPQGDDEDEPVTERLERDLFGLHRIDWSDGGVEFHLPHGEWIRLLRETGFEVEGLVELQAPEGATTRHSPYVTGEWARRWPAEEVWKARKR